MLIPQKMRQELGLAEGTVVQLEKDRSGIVITQARRKRLSWKDLNGMHPTRTGQPEWPTPEEIKGIWE